MKLVIMNISSKIHYFPNMYTLKLKILSFVFSFVENRFIKTDYNSEILKKYCSGKVLDMGCGTGKFINELMISYPDNLYFGIDPSKQMIKKAKDSRINADFFVGDCINNKFKKNEFNALFLKNVIHHIPKEIQEKSLEKSLQISNHVIIFDKVNSKNYIIRLLKNCWWRITDGGEKYLTEREWSLLLKELKCNIIKRYISYPFQHNIVLIIQKK